jgi:hypothetical protein
MVLLTNTKDVRARCRTYQISPAWVAPREGRPARSPRREGVMTQRSIVRLREEGRAAREGKAPAAPCCRQGEGRAAAPGRREAAPPAGEEWGPRAKEEVGPHHRVRAIATPQLGRSETHAGEKRASRHRRGGARPAQERREPRRWWEEGGSHERSTRWGRCRNSVADPVEWGKKQVVSPQRGTASFLAPGS